VLFKLRERELDIISRPKEAENGKYRSDERARLYCAPLSLEAQNANGYLNWISASRLTLTRISAVVASENGID
jgi:hypothetical protein